MCPQLTSWEAGWVEGDNYFLRYAQVATAKDVAGMHPDALTRASPNGGRVWLWLRPPYALLVG